ncbi:MAG: hypothetical protein L0Z53_06540 [Acidobacteriales bacterium]|nr:hypothetical protein [Terriglobales bacterium]
MADYPYRTELSVKVPRWRDKRQGGGSKKPVAQWAMKRRIARLTALGLTAAEIGDELGLTTELVLRAQTYSDVVERVKALQDDADALIRDALADGELVAAETLYNLMKTAQNEKVRLEAAVQFLDRMGLRGPIEQRINQRTVQLTGDAAQAALVQALRDPQVREWLTNERPDLRAKLLGPAPEPAP